MDQPVIEESILRDKVRFLYGQLPMASASFVIIAALVFIFFHDSTPSVFLEVWIGLILLAAIIKMAAYAGFVRYEAAFPMKKWNSLFTWSAFFCGFSLGFIKLEHLFGHSFSLAADLFFLFIIGAVCAATVAAYSASLPAVAVFLAAALTPLGIGHLWDPTPATPDIIALTAALYFPFLLALAWRLNGFFHQSLVAAHERDGLLRKVSADEARLAEAQKIAKLGSFEWNIAANTSFQSDQSCRNLGLEPGEMEITYQRFLEFIHPEDRAAVDAALKRQMDEKAPKAVYEFRILRRDGSIHFNRSDVEVEFGPGGAPAVIRGSSQDVTELEQAKREVERFFNVAVNGMVIASADGYFKKVNPAFCRMLGYTQEELEGCKFIELVHPEDREPTIMEVEKQLSGGSTLNFVNRYVARGGRVVHICWTGAMDPRNGLLYASAEDVTEKKRIEGELRTQAAINANIREGIQMTRISDSVIVHANRRFERIFGYGPGELIGKHVSILNYPTEEKSAELRAEEINDALIATGEWRGEIINRKKDGTPFWCEATITRYNDPVHGDVMLTLQNDITEQKRLRDKIAESEAWHRSLFHKAPDAIITADASTGIVMDVNEAACRLLGRRREQLVGIHQAMLHPEGYREKGRAEFKRHSASGGEKPHESMVLGADGAEIPVEITAHTVRLGDKSILQGHFRDIRERKKAEDALRQSEERFRFLAENSQDLIYIYRVLPRPGFDYVSPSATKITGYTPEEHYMSPDLGMRLVHPDDRHLIEKMAAGGEVKGPLALRWITKSGRTIWTEQSNSFIHGPDGSVVAINGVARDITGRKEAEDALRASEQKFLRFFTQVPIPLGVVTSTGKITHLNAKFTELFGYLPEDVPMIADWYKKAYPDEAYRRKVVEAWEKAAARAAVEGTAIELKEYDVLCKDGGVRNVMISGVTLGDDLLATFIDITSRVKAEGAMRASEERLRLIFENAPVGITHINPEGVVIECNEMHARIFGTRPESIIGLNLPAIMKNEGQKAAIREAMAGRLGFFEGGYTSVLTGKSVVLRSIFAPVAAADGRVAGIVSFTEDITERKMAEERLAKSEAHYRNLLDSIDAAVVVHSADTRILAVNKKALELLGLTAGQALGREAMHPEWKFLTEGGDALPLNEYPVNQVLSSGAPLKPTVVGINRPVTQDVVWVVVNAYPVAEGGAIREVVVTFMDVTAQKLMTEQLARAKTTAEEATALKDRFVSLVAHDLKNPIGTIGGFLRHILAWPDPGLSPEHLEIIRRVEQTSGQMSRMIEDLLDVTRLATGMIKPAPVFFEPRELVNIIFSQAALMARNKGVRLVNDIPEHARVLADVALLRQAITNVVTNAIKFSRTAGTVRVFYLKDSNTLMVEDDGVGIAKEILENLFRADVKTTTRGTAGEKGTGLGLPYVQDIMRAHGGDVCAESELGKGSRFHLTLPAARPLALVAEDDPSSRALVRAMLEKMDYMVEAVSDGLQAVKALERTKPHIILVDLSMPGMDGLSALKAIRADRKFANTPIVVITAMDSVESREQALRAGANDFLSKPLEADTARLRINNLVLFRDFVRG